MPIYEYFCPSCKCKFELMKPMSQAAEAGVCPKCGGTAQRILSLFCRSSEGESASGSTSACRTCSATTCSTCSR